MACRGSKKTRRRIRAEPSLATNRVVPYPQPGNFSTTKEPLRARTFFDSSYKRFYENGEVAVLQRNLLYSVREMLWLFAKRMHSTNDYDCALKGKLDSFMKEIQDDAFTIHQQMPHDDVAMLAEYLCLCDKKHAVVQGMRFRDVINAVIKDDIPEEVKAAAVIFRSIGAKNRSSRGVSASDQSYPTNRELWRGGNFRSRFKIFFQNITGCQFRVPGFLVCSKDKQVATTFVSNADKAHPCVLWRIVFDNGGKCDHQLRAQRMTFVSNTWESGSDKFYFMPYSVFTLVSVKWSVELVKPHEFTIRPVCNIYTHNEEVPLAPWY